MLRLKTLYAIINLYMSLKMVQGDNDGNIALRGIFVSEHDNYKDARWEKVDLKIGTNNVLEKRQDRYLYVIWETNFFNFYGYICWL